MLDVEAQIRRHAIWVRTQMPTLDLPALDLPALDLPSLDLPRGDAEPTRPASTPPTHSPRPPEHPLAGDAETPGYPVEAAGRGRKWAWVGAAAAAVVVLVAAVAVVASRPDTTRNTTTGTTPASVPAPATAATGPDSALKPTWVPPGVQLWGITATNAPGHPGLLTTYTYATGSHDSDPMTVITCPGGGDGCAPTYAEVRANGTTNPDGSVTRTSPAVLQANSTTSVSGPTIMLDQVWPDGASVHVVVDRGPLDVDDARRIASSIELTDPAGLTVLRTELTNRILALPLLARADLSNGSVELRGAGLVRAVCVRPDATDGSPATTITCSSASFTPAGSPPPTAPDTTSLIVDGRWVVAATMATTGTLSFTPQPANGDVGNLPPPFDAQTTTLTAAGTAYALGMVVVPDGVASIFAVITQPGSSGGAGVDRPSF